MQLALIEGGASAVPKYRPGTMGAAPKRPTINQAADVYGQMGDLRGAEVEHMVVFDLNSRHQVIERRVIGIGGVGGVDCHPREVFRGAIRNGAAAIIAAHNHPSGDPKPSVQDRELTNRLREVGNLVGISLLDHVVVTEGGFTSLVE